MWGCSVLNRFALLLLVGCGPGADSVEVQPAAAPVALQPAVGLQPDMVVFLLSGLRADAPGQPAAEATWWRAMALDTAARSYDAAYAQSSSPFVSLGSLLTGRYPAAIPLCGLDAAQSPSDGGRSEAVWCASIPSGQHTLPEVLGLYGYRTGLITHGISGARVLAEGFQQWRDVARDPDSSTDFWSALGQQAIGWWGADDSRPRFLLVAASYLSREHRLRMEPHEPGTPSQAGPLVDASQRQEILEEYRQQAQVAGVAAGRVLRALTGASQRPPWLVLGSLNGISLVETGGFHQEPVEPYTHNVLTDRTLRVPLALMGPGIAESGPVADIVELVDIFPTLARLAGALPPSGLPGADLLRLPAEAPASAFAYAELGDMIYLREENWALAFRTFLHDRTSLDPELDQLLFQPRGRDEPFFTLYDVAQDPWQRHDLARSRPADFQRMLGRMKAIRGGVAAVPTDALDAHKVWELRMSRTQSYW